MDKRIIVALEKVEANPGRYEITLNEEQAEELLAAITGAFGYEGTSFSRKSAEEWTGRTFTDNEWNTLVEEFYDSVQRLFQDYEA